MEDLQVPDTQKPDALEARASRVLANQIDTPKSSQGLYDLPCGYLDASGNLYTDVVLREITGAEEDLLSNPKIPSHKKINELLSRCVVRIGPITDRGLISQIVVDLLVGDRVFLMFAIRRISLGDEYTFKDECPTCEVERLFSVDLSELDIRGMPKPKCRSYPVTLPSGKTATFHPMTGGDEDRMNKLNKSKTDTVSLAIQMRLDELANETPTLDSIKKLGIKDRNFLRTQFELNEGGIETEIDLECAECETSMKREVDIGQQSFFYPSAIQKSSKPKSST